MAEINSKKKKKKKKEKKIEKKRSRINRRSYYSEYCNTIGLIDILSPTVIGWTTVAMGGVYRKKEKEKEKNNNSLTQRMWIVFAAYAAMQHQPIFQCESTTNKAHKYISRETNKQMHVNFT